MTEAHSLSDPGSPRALRLRWLALVTLHVALAAPLATAQVEIAGHFSARFPHESFDIARALDRAYVGSTFLGEVHVVDVARNEVLGVMDGRGGGYAALSPDESRVIVSASGTEHRFFRTSDNLREATIPVGEFGGEITLGVGWSGDSDHAYVLRVKTTPFEPSVLYKIDAAAFTVVDQVEVGGLSIFARDFLHVAPGGSRALVVDTFADPTVVRVVDTDAMEVLGEIEVGAAPSAVAFDRTGRRAWVLATGSDRIRLLDLGTLAVIDEITTADNPTGLSFDEGTGRLAVSTLAGVTQLFDAETGALLVSAPTPDGSGVTLQPTVGTGLVAVGDADQVVVVDFDPASATFGTVLQTLFLPGCGGGTCAPTAVALHPDGLRGYVLAANRQRIDVLDLPKPDVSIYLVPEADAFGAGEDVRFLARVTNHTSEPRDVTARFDVLKPNGNPFSGNPVLGPATRRLGPGRVVTRTLRFRIGATVPPSGPYFLVGTVESDAGPMAFSSEFPFLVE